MIDAGKEIASRLRDMNVTIVITSLIHEEGIREGLLKIYEKEVSVPEILGFKHILNNAALVDPDGIIINKLLNHISQNTPITIFGSGNLGKK